MGHINERIAKHLNDGECLLWDGVPENFEIMDTVHKKNIITKIVICSVIDIALIALYTGYALKQGIKINVPVLLIINVCCLYAALGFLIDAKKIRASMYCITDQRILHIFEDSIVKEIPFDKIKEFRLEKDDAGISTLLIGKKASRLRTAKQISYAMAPAHSDDKTGETYMAVFYAVPEAGKVEKLLKQNTHA